MIKYREIKVVDAKNNFNLPIKVRHDLFKRSYQHGNLCSGNLFVQIATSQLESKNRMALSDEDRDFLEQDDVVVDLRGV